MGGEEGEGEREREGEGVKLLKGGELGPAAMDVERGSSELTESCGRERKKFC
jgi:hypothetical protein